MFFIKENFFEKINPKQNLIKGWWILWMISYTKRYINIVSFLITILIFILITNFSIILKQIDFNLPPISYMFKRKTVLVELSSSNIKKDTQEEVTEIKNKSLETELQNNYGQKEIWKIIIPKISLEAEISEGTSKEVMNKYVGHFEETSIKNGNIGLAAHNRGYEVNYFKKIKQLKQGDKIIYKYKDFEKIYTVDKNIIIKDTDWSYLERTEENKITLITCVENEPEYRRCVQAIEKK